MASNPEAGVGGIKPHVAQLPSSLPCPEDPGEGGQKNAVLNLQKLLQTPADRSAPLSQITSFPWC